MTKTLIPVERVQQAILLIRGEKVILDADLALIYGVSTKRLNEQVKRNRSRFPDDFMFQLTSEEKDEVVANCDHLRRLKFSPNLPHAFTEHGTTMAANVLNSDRAIHASVEIVRAFVGLRLMLGSNAELSRRLTELEGKYDRQFKVVFDAIRQLMSTPLPARKQIGFRQGSQNRER
jgi:hypothetical protein